jgi:hypothetical protein
MRPLDKLRFLGNLRSGQGWQLPKVLCSLRASLPVEIRYVLEHDNREDKV